MQCRCADFYQVVDGCKAQLWVETLPHMFLFIVAVGFPRYPVGVQPQSPLIFILMRGYMSE